MAAAGASNGVDRMLAMSRILQPHERAGMFTDRFLVERGEDEIRAAVGQHLQRGTASVLGETLHLDRQLALVDNMFLYFDKMSMAASLEVRVPFMDHPLVEWCAALPDSRRVFRMRRKELLRRASRGLVPDSIIDKKKQGFFHSALGAWMRAHGGNLFEDVLLDARARERGLYREDALRAAIGTAGEGGKKPSQRLFCLFLLEKWQRLYVDSDGAGRRRPQAARAAL
jgi:asparagine synthase (glutamine-hydrolysing)